LAKKAGEIEDETKELLKKVGGVFGKTGGGVKLPPIHFSMDLLRQTRPGYWRTDLNAHIPFKPDQNLHLGLYDAFESNKVNAQLGQQFLKNSEYRYGVYASKPAVGVDFRFAPGFDLRGDLFDMNDPRFDMRAGYELRSGFVGWIGMDQI